MPAIQDHPLAACFPLLSDAELKELGADMKVNGQNHPIILLDGKILDGRNRYRACRMAGIEPVFQDFDGTDPLAFVISENIHRRHMDASQRAMAGAELEKIGHGGDRRSQDAPVHLDRDRDAIAEKLDVSPRSIAAAKKVKEEAEPEIVEAVKAGKLPVKTAEKASKLPPKKQREIAKSANPKKAAQEAVKQAEPEIIPPTPVDAWGIPIQSHAAEAFQAVPKFKELVAAISTAQKLFNEVANLAGGKFLQLPDVSSYRRGKKTGDGEYQDRFVHTGLENALQHVKNAIPTHTVCPWHFVDGKHPEKCTTCHGQNWTPVLGSNIPDMAKERARKKFNVKED